MSDVAWGRDHLEPPRKRKIPWWVWGCGGGCMFLIGAIIVATWLVGPKVTAWMQSLGEPDVQWPRLAEVLPFDERPAGVKIERWPVPFLEIWMLEEESKDLFAFVFSPPKDDDRGPWAEWLTDPKQSPMFARQEGSFESSESTIVVQGRELRSVRFRRTNLPPPVDPTGADPAEETPEALPERAMIHGSGLGIVITFEDSSRVVLMWLVRGRRGETVSDEETLQFLAPFEIGTQH